MGIFTRTFNYSFLIAGVLVSLGAVLFGMNYVLKKNKAKKTDLQIEVYEYGTGYGYRIFSEEEILIQQNFIPALEDKRPFCDREEADRIASYVVQKIRQGSNPAISLSELRELKISFNCAE